MPSDLYRFARHRQRAGHAQRQRRPASRSRSTRATRSISRKWKAGDTIDLDLADAGAPRRRHTMMSPPTATASRCSADRSSTPPSGPTIPAATSATSVAGRCGAGTRIPAGAVERRGGDQRAGRVVCRRRAGAAQSRDAAVHRDPVLRVGQSRPGEMTVWLPRDEAAAGRFRSRLSPRPAPPPCRPVAGLARSTIKPRSFLGRSV